MLIRREAVDDADVIRAVTSAAFARDEAPGEGSVAGSAPAEATLVDELGGGPAWIPELSLVAVTPAGEVVGHVLCTRGHVGREPVLGLGPLSVRPDWQRRGVGRALVHGGVGGALVPAVLGAADALGEPLVALLGDPGYYQRFGFRLSSEYAITPPQ